MRYCSQAVSALLLWACAANQPESRGTSAPGAATEPAEEIIQTTLSTQDGTSPEHAILIEADNEREGGAKEYRWIAERFPGYRVRKQGLAKQEQRTYAVMEITDAAEIEHVFYFDVSSFIGKK
jgi:hypothetical protein